MIDSARSATTSTATADSAWTLRIDGMGPVSIGMTVAQASQALRGRSDNALTADTTSDCQVILLPGAPGVVRLMVADGYLGAIYTTDSTVRSERGARVGDREATIQSLYAGRVSVEPHKYVEQGHNLVVSSPAPRDSLYRIIFETDGVRVTEMRAGMLPVVAFSEHCS